MLRKLRAITALTLAALAGGVGAIGLADATGALGETATVRESATTTARSESPARLAARGRALSIKEIYDRTKDGVVEITVDSRGGSDGATPFGFPDAPRSVGSGFVIDREGHIVTNQHVVGDATTVTVTFSDGEQAHARVIGTDPSSDLAVLEVTGEDDRTYTPLELADSARVEIGDAVVAIGNPFGLERTVTAGIVSALDREIEAPNGFTIDGAVQTDAALNGGNSGGPLLDDQGRVIGVNSQIQTENGGNVGIGYAVPSNTVRQVVAELLADGEVERAYLGVGLEEVTEELAERRDLPAGSGVLLTQVVEDGPADRAGLRAGDVVTAIDGTRVESAADVRAAVSSKRPGDSVTVEIRRGGETQTLRVELGRRPASVTG